MELDEDRVDYIKVNVPADGSCLFWSVVLAYLLPVKDNKDDFEKRYTTLFGNTQHTKVMYVHNLFSKIDIEYYILFNDVKVQNLVFIFRNRVVDHISNYKEKYEEFIDGALDEYLMEMKLPNTWGGEVEIRAMSDMLISCIEVSGILSTSYGSNFNLKIQLIHVNNGGSNHDRNHYNFYLEDKNSKDQQKQNDYLTLPNTIVDKQVQNNYSFVGIPKFGTTHQTQPIPTPTSRVVMWSGWYTDEQIKLNTNLIFVFGDNDKAKYRLSNDNPGGHGQALATRPTGAGKLPFDRLSQHGGSNGNAIGITTTFYGGYIPDLEEFKRLMANEFGPLEIWVKGGGCVIVPCNSQGKANLGTGIAALERIIPGAIQYIDMKVNDLIVLGQQILQQNINIEELKTKVHLILLNQRYDIQKQRDLKTYLKSDNTDFEPRLIKFKLDYQNDDISDNIPSQDTLNNPSKVNKRTIITDNDREIDEKKLKTVDGYIASDVKSSLHGTIYQLKLLMLFLKRGIDLKYSFCLATEMDRAEKFDDVVFQYIENGKKCCRFLQAKHKQDETKKITTKDLLTENDDEFSLQKYFISCNKIKTHSEFIDLDFIDFVICTNIDLEEDLKKYFQLLQNDDKILGDIKLDNKETFRYKLKTNNCELKDKLSSILQNTSDLRRLVKRLAEYLVSGDVLSLRDDLIKSYHGVLAKTVIDVINIEIREFTNTKKIYAKFHAEFLSTKLQDQNSLIFREALMKSYWKIIKIPIEHRNEDTFLKDMANRQFHLSSSFGKVFRPESNIEFNDSDLEKFVQAIVSAIDKAADNIAIISRRNKIIKDNIEKLAGYILIKKEEERDKDIYYFSSKFLNEHIKLPGDLEMFRRSLMAKMKTKHIDIDKTCYKFRIPNYLSCVEEELFDNTLQDLPTDQISDSDINDFLQKLVFAVNQPDEITLGEIIKKELGKDFNNIDSKNVYARFLEEVLNWMKEKEGRFFTYADGSDLFNKLYKDILGPVWFNVKEPVRFYTGRKESLNDVHSMIHKNKNNMTVISQMATVSGLGGIGKTELAKRYIQEYGKTHYKNVIWIDAENESTLEESFYCLAKDNRLGIPTKDKDHADKPASELVKEIYRFFAKRICLFIFDNAETGEYLDKFLPLQTLANDSLKPFILITSRLIRDDWEQLGIDEGITLDVFTDEESLNFIKTSLSINEDVHDDIIKYLAGTILYNFPLALQQMVAYVREQNKKTKRRRKVKYSFEDYVKEYEAETRKILDNSTFKNLDNDYAKTTYTTWTMTVKKIQKIDNDGYAIDILELIAYFAPNKIPVECFCKFMLNEEDVWNSVEILNKYSMIKLEEGYIDVHRLVQEVTIIKLHDKGIEADVARIAFNVMQDNFPYDIITSTEDCSSIKELLPHLEHLLQKLKNLLSKDAKYKEEIEKEYLEYLLEYLIDAYNILGHPKKQVELLEWAIKIETKRYGDEDVEVARLLSNLAQCQEELGNYSEQRKLLERALYIEEKALGDDHETVASTLVNLSTVYEHTGQDQKRKIILEKALNIQRKHYGDDHVKVAVTLCNLGIVYGHLGDRVQQKQYLEEALAINQKYYGENHYKYADTFITLGNAYGDWGDYATQLKMIEKALAIQENHYGDNHHLLAETLINLSDAFRDSGNLLKQKELREKALQIQQCHYGPEHITIIDTLVEISKAHYDLGETKEQRECLLKALLIFEAHEDDENFENANTITLLGNAFGNIGNHELQKKILNKSLQIQTKHCGNEYFGIATTIADLATAYGDLKEYDKQQELLEEALAIQIKHFGEEHIQIVPSLVALSLTEGHLGNNNQQQILLDKVSEIIEKHWNIEHLDVSNALLVLSNAYGELEKYSQQIINLNKALEIEIKYYGERHIKIVDILMDLSFANENMGNYQEQKSYLEKVLQIQRDLYGDSHIKVASTLIDLSKVYGYLADYEIQNDFLQQAYRIQRSNNIIQIENGTSIEEYLEI